MSRAVVGFLQLSSPIMTFAVWTHQSSLLRYVAVIMVTFWRFFEFRSTFFGKLLAKNYIQSGQDVDMLILHVRFYVSSSKISPLIRFAFCCASRIGSRCYSKNIVIMSLFHASIYWRSCEAAWSNFFLELTVWGQRVNSIHLQIFFKINDWRIFMVKILINRVGNQRGQLLCVTSV